MSMAYKRPSLALHFTWKLEPEAVMNIIPRIEAKLAPFQPRPHWGKVFTMNTAQITPLYPRINDFRALCHEFDPKGKFRNKFIHDHVDTA
jgi:xylitol oxidase